MILKAAAGFAINMSQSFLAGDKMADMEAGRAAEVLVVFLGSDKKFSFQIADLCASDMETAAKTITPYEKNFRSIK